MKAQNCANSLQGHIPFLYSAAPGNALVTPRAEC